MMRVLAVQLFLSLLLLIAREGRAQALDPLLKLEQAWSTGPEDFQKAAADLPFQWTSNAKDSARAAKPGMTLLSLPVVECVARFQNEKLTELTAVFYARGDAGSIPKDTFDSLVRRCAETFNGFTGLKFTPRPKESGAAVKADGIFWQNDKARYVLEYSVTKEVKSRNIDFRAEFVRLTVTAPEKRASMLSTTSSARQKFSGPTHLKKDAKTGEVVIPDVPMVDQGQKGYCVVAATERVLRYYSIDVDANELAQVANSDAERGTSLEGMFAALKKIATRLRVRVREIEGMDVKGILGLVKDYNREAKRSKNELIPDPGNRIDVGAIYSRMQFEVLREARTRNKSDLTRFQRTLQGTIDQGIPLLWSVQLGLSPEPGIPQSAGGHMRLLIGYNLSTQEVLFSDSWGAGHELKRMPMADAWAITTGLMLVEPL
jgi:hypothetical protein